MEAAKAAPPLTREEQELKELHEAEVIISYVSYFIPLESVLATVAIFVVLCCNRKLSQIRSVLFMYMYSICVVGQHCCTKDADMYRCYNC